MALPGLLLFSLALVLVGVVSAQHPLNTPNPSIKYPTQPPRQNPFIKPPGAGYGIQTQRPYNIAHRGANNVYPEESEQAYKLAIDLGADFIESDIQATKDGVLVCFHDIGLNLTTDVSTRPEFASKLTTYNDITGGDGTNTDWFLVDFTYDELKTLKLKQRFPYRDQSFNGQFSIITFERYIQIAQEANRVVGIYPEIKSPRFNKAHVQFPGGKSFEQAVVDLLNQYGYGGPYLTDRWLAKPLFIQCFAYTSLLEAKKYTDSPLVFLYDSLDARTQDTNETYASLSTDAAFDMLKSIGVVGLGPYKANIQPINTTTNYYSGKPNDFVTRAHNKGFEVHPYTYRADTPQLVFDLHGNFFNEFIYFDKVIGVDGFFTDFTESAFQYLEWTHPIFTKSDIYQTLIFQ
ncbi:glycerophosphoryl diester phosphodiesterase [Klebsormidium nitens]|uniref:glycerophosphodiester phosphodiesterase n=1 Tax=Klebsormidium nitens TaxID=105231 RepID=A0A1Y1HX03_KLENI|nr:glycerophosphoryl diester phosphodiesterase [Klebsormidium nitens]|eukprot:GAQ83190.1 glycerophosphoryl diester phosphodiesterase [Klebsormidium nitens]